MKRHDIVSFISGVGLIAVLTAGGFAAAVKPKDAEYAISKAEALRKEKKWDESAAMLKKALSMSPSGYNRWAYMGLGELYFERGMFGKSQEYFHLVESREPEFLLPSFYIGQMQYLTGKSAKTREQRIASYNSALRNFDKVAKGGSGNIGAEGHIGRALVDMKLALREDAQKSVGNAKADDPKIQAALKAAFTDNKASGQKYRQAYYDDACKLLDNLRRSAQNPKIKPIASIARVSSLQAPNGEPEAAVDTSVRMSQAMMQSVTQPVSAPGTKPYESPAFEDLTLVLPADGDTGAEIKLPPAQTNIALVPATITPATETSKAGVTLPAVPDGPFKTWSVEQKADYVVQQYQTDKNNKAVGVELLPVAGVLTTNGFGYPKKFLGYTIAFGYTTRTYRNLPDSKDVRDLADTILEADPYLDYDEIADKIHLKLNPGHFDFLEYGTEALVLPKVSIGQSIPLKKNRGNRSYFQWKVGIPIPLSVGFAFEF